VIFTYGVGERELPMTDAVKFILAAQLPAALGDLLRPIPPRPSPPIVLFSSSVCDLLVEARF
jgi:hypothetical protein